MELVEHGLKNKEIGDKGWAFRTGPSKFT